MVVSAVTMRSIKSALPACLASALISAAAWADAPANPYQAVVERNPFGLREPPPPKAEIPLPPAVPLPKVVLTGIITSLFGAEPKVLLEVTEQEPGKAASVKKPILRRGEKEGTIEILTVDIANSEVRIRNGMVETNLTFEVAKSSGGPVPGAPSIPGMVAPVPPPALPGAATSASAAGSPTIISPGGANAAGRANTGISVFGGAAAPVNYASASAVNTASYNGAANYGRAATGLTPVNNTGISAYNSGVSTYGGGNIPTRDVRTDPASSAQQQKIDNYDGAQALDKIANQYNQTHNIPPLPMPKPLYGH